MFLWRCLACFGAFYPRRCSEVGLREACQTQLALNGRGRHDLSRRHGCHALERFVLHTLILQQHRKKASARPSKRVCVRVSVCVCNAVRDAAETAIDRTHTPHAETGKGAGMRSIHQRANSAQFHTVPNNISALSPKIQPVKDLYMNKDSSSRVGGSLHWVIQNRSEPLKWISNAEKRKKPSRAQTEACTLNHYKEKIQPFMRSSLFSCKCLTVDG